MLRLHKLHLYFLPICCLGSSKTLLLSNEFDVTWYKTGELIGCCSDTVSATSNLAQHQGEHVISVLQHNTGLLVYRQQHVP